MLKVVLIELAVVFVIFMFVKDKYLPKAKSRILRTYVHQVACHTVCHVLGVESPESSIETLC